jgi:UDP-N-acetylmuramate dehydrogenase
MDILPVYQQLISKYPEIKISEQLNEHCTFGIGGKADLFWLCKNVNDLPQFLKKVDDLEIKYFVFGGGSNVLFDSKGYRGIIIKIIDSHFSFEKQFLEASAGAKVTILSKMSMKLGLSGLEEFDGLPGTIGGAVYGNAGCHGKEISKYISKVKLFNKVKGIYEVTKDYFEFNYRESKLKKTKEIILEVTLKLLEKSIDAEKQKNANNFRKENQPWGYTCGSFFKNPKPYSAGKLIEECGLKGFKIGGAQISEKHANFFMNINNASSEDILNLKNLAKTKVKEKFNINLEEEVIIVPEI